MAVLDFHIHYDTADHLLIDHNALLFVVMFSTHFDLMKHNNRCVVIEAFLPSFFVQARLKYFFTHIFLM